MQPLNSVEDPAGRETFKPWTVTNIFRDNYL